MGAKMLQHSTILVVDDQVSVLRILSKYLSENLYCKNIIQASSAEKGLEVLAENSNIDWIFSDWEMPGMDGCEFLHTIRSDPATSEIPFIMVTARNDKDAMVTAAQAGVTDILIKPFTAALLVQKVRKLSAMFERRAMERFKDKYNSKVDLAFDHMNTSEGALVDISEEGCLVRLPAFKENTPCIYEIAELAIKTDYGYIQLKGELVRLEKTEENYGSAKFVLAAFNFFETGADRQHAIKSFIESLTTEDLN